MNLPLPEANSATAAEVREWLDRFALCVREVDYAAARPFWHPDIVIFGTLSGAGEKFIGVDGTAMGQCLAAHGGFPGSTWQTVWSWPPRTARWQSQSHPGRAPVSMKMEWPSTVRAGPQ